VDSGLVKVSGAFWIKFGRTRVTELSAQILLVHTHKALGTARFLRSLPAPVKQGLLFIWGEILLRRLIPAGMAAFGPITECRLCNLQQYE